MKPKTEKKRKPSIFAGRKLTAAKSVPTIEDPDPIGLAQSDKNFVEEVDKLISPQPDLKKAPKKHVAQTDPREAGRMPPHSAEAEQGALGCMFLAPEEIMAETQNMIPEWFYDLRHRTIFELLLDMAAKGEAIDAVTFQQRLKDRNQLLAVGGLAFISSLPDMVPSAANFPYYKAIVREKFMLRKMIHICTDAVGRAYGHQGEVDGLVDDFSTQVMKMADSGQAVAERSSMEIIRDNLPKWGGYVAEPGKIDGLTTGLADVDRKLWGLRDGEVIVIGGRPSAGKSSLAMNIAEHNAIDCGLPVGIVSLEMSADSLMFRTVCTRARVNSMDVRKGAMGEEELTRFTQAQTQVAKAPLYIDARSGLNSAQIRASFKRMIRKYKIRLGVLDYLQLVANETKRGENREREVAQVSNAMKSIAGDFGIPMIVLAQLNRDHDKGKKRAPKMSDLRESGSIESDADIIGLLYDPKDEGEESEEAAVRTEYRVNLRVAKNRNGETGDVALWFRKTLTKFEGYTKTEAAQ